MRCAADCAPTYEEPNSELGEGDVNGTKLDFGQVDLLIELGFSWFERHFPHFAPEFSLWGVELEIGLDANAVVPARPLQPGYQRGIGKSSVCQ